MLDILGNFATGNGSPVRKKFVDIENKLMAIGRDLFNNDARIGVALVQGKGNSIFESERQIVFRASNSRKNQFFSGRKAARFALKELGLLPCAIPANAFGAPIWPQGIVGSISHTADIAIAAVMESKAKRLGLGIGIDIENCMSVDDELAPLILSRDEMMLFYKRPKTQLCYDPTIIFSAKESFFKAHFPLNEQWLEFNDITVVLNSAQVFSVRFTQGSRFYKESAINGFGRISIVEGLIATSYVYQQTDNV